MRLSARSPRPGAKCCSEEQCLAVLPLAALPVECSNSDVARAVPLGHLGELDLDRLAPRRPRQASGRTRHALRRTGTTAGLFLCKAFGWMWECDGTARPSCSMRGAGLGSR